MDPLAAEYSKLRPKQFPARELRETAEGRYWKGFTLPSTVKQVRMHIEIIYLFKQLDLKIQIYLQFGAVTSLNYASEQPHYLAVTSSTRVSST